MNRLLTPFPFSIISFFQFDTSDYLKRLFNDDEKVRENCMDYIEANKEFFSNYIVGGEVNFFSYI